MFKSPFLISGKVVEGDKRGRLLDFPTANLAVMPKDIAFGVYVAWTKLDSNTQKLPSLAYWGKRQTFGKSEPVFEVYLMNGGTDLYGKTLDIELVDFIREDQLFDSSEALVNQIKKDILLARKILLIKN